MKKTICLAILLLILSAVGAFAQAPACNTGAVQGTVEGALNSCIAQSRQNLTISFGVICDCPGTGITVNVFGAPRCNPNEFCPLYLVLVGSAQLDCNGNLISSTCGFF